MIFDDYDNLSDLVAPNRDDAAPNANMRTSLDDFLSERNGVSGNRYYEAYQIDVNKNFLTVDKHSKLAKSQVKKSKIAVNNLITPVKKTERINERSTGLKCKTLSSESISHESCNEALSLSIEELSLNHSVHFQDNIDNKVCSVPSIDDTLQNNKKSHSNEHENIEIRSQYLPASFRVNKLSLRRTKSQNNVSTDNQSIKNVKLNSMVCLDNLIKEEKQIKVEAELCSICLDSYNLKEMIAKLKSCGHIFHKVCIDEWIDKPGYLALKCPFCKTAM